MHGIIHGGELRPKAAVKSCEAVWNSAEQSQFPLLSSMQKAPKDAPAQILRQIDSEAQAVAVSMKACGAKLAYVAACLGKSQSYISMIRKGQRPMPAKLVKAFCWATGTNLLRQYLDLQEALRALAEPSEQDRINRLAASLSSQAAA
jgi:hypothetical protein